MKALTFSFKKRSSGRNSSGRITSYHRGGGAKRLQRRIDIHRNNTGIVQKVEYDPNRSSLIALVRWHSPEHPLLTNITNITNITRVSYVLAGATYKEGLVVQNSQPLSSIPLGTNIFNVEWNPGQGGKLARAAGCFAQLLSKMEDKGQCVIRLSSGTNQLIDMKCRATVGIVSNEFHNQEKLRKAGQNRWLGRRPIVRGVAMNPVDHPHGGRTKGGRPSVSPWGKATKGGFKTRKK